MHMPACLVSSKSGAAVSRVPSQLSFLTSRHWLTFAVESLKKLYNRTCRASKTYDISPGRTYIIEFQTLALVQRPIICVTQM